jgi:hypothetical protein
VTTHLKEAPRDSGEGSIRPFTRRVFADVVFLGVSLGLIAMAFWLS